MRVMSDLRRHTLVVALLALVASVSPAQGQTDPRDIIERIDRLLRGDSSRAIATMEVVTEHWERRMTMEMWSLGPTIRSSGCVRPRKRPARRP